MEQARIDMFIMAYAENFSPYKISEIRERLKYMDEYSFMAVQTANYNKPVMVLIVSLLGGHLGIDRFMIGDIGLGVLKLLTCGGLGIWTIIDWFLIMDLTKESNYAKFLRAAQ